MDTEQEPVIGNWYLDIQRETPFTIVDMDEDEELVEVQYIDGDLEQIELSAWYEMELEEIEEPDDWSAVETDLNDDDAGPGDWQRAARDWGDSGDDIGFDEEEL